MDDSPSQTQGLLTGSYNRPSSPKSFSERLNLPFLILIITSLLTLLNLISLPFHPSTLPPAILTSISLGKLPRPTQYPGLASIDYPLIPTYNKSKQFIFPSVLAQVDSTKPDWVGEEDVNRKWTEDGVLTGDDKHLVLSDTITSFAQFRTIDHDVHLCALRFYFRSRTRLGANSNRTLTSGFPYWNISTNDNYTIEIYDFYPPTNHLLDLTSLSYNTRPTRGELRDKVQVSAGRISTSKIWPCSTGQLFNFELVCKGDGGGRCGMIQAWEDKLEPVGVVLLHTTSHYEKDLQPPTS